jgi:hypothetical protein
MLYDTVHFFFQDGIIKNIKDLYFQMDYNLSYINNSHAHYIYEKEMNQKNYIFHGFYLNGYFIIIIDIYDKILEVSISEKKVLLFTFPWIKKNIDDKYNLFVLNIENKTYKYIEFNHRKKIEEETNLSIADLLIINKSKNKECEVKYVKKYELNQEHHNEEITYKEESSHGKQIIQKITYKLTKWFL